MHENTAQRIRYGRFIALGFGVFCLLMALNELLGGLNLGFARIPPRWDPAIVTFPRALRAEFGISL